MRCNGITVDCRLRDLYRFVDLKIRMRFLKSESLAFWTEARWPKYRKIVNGEERLLDGTETDETEIVKHDLDPEYVKAVEAMLKAKH